MLAHHVAAPLAAVDTECSRRGMSRKSGQFAPRNRKVKSERTLVAPGIFSGPLFLSDRKVGVKKFLLVIALVVMVSCSNNGSSREATDTHDAAVPQSQSENIEPSDAAMTTANLKGVAVAREAALTGCLLYTSDAADE